MRTAIVGLGVTGLSCVRFLEGDDELVVVDTRAAPPMLATLQAQFPAVRVHTGVSDFDFSACDRVVVSPGVSLDSCLLHGVSGPLVSDIDLFCEAATAPIYAITGTNGKSTVTSLTGHLLNHAGRHTPVGGNLGDAALEVLSADADAYVLELSSFQLERMQAHRLRAATILNVSEDHLDRHGDMEAYVASKQRIYRNCDLAVALRGDPSTYPARDVPQLVTFGADAPDDERSWGVREVDGERWLAEGSSNVLPVSELPIRGRHNELNALAACALLHDTGISTEVLTEGLRSFTGLPHRCQHVAVVSGVSYVNDSKATNVGATLAALEGLGDAGEPRIVLIAGGDGKGAEFSALREAVQRHVKTLVLIGRDGPLLAHALTGATAITRAESMREAVEVAARAAAAGDTVLLSPACASFDMYSGFAARGDDFSACVGGLDGCRTGST